ncbi:MAG: hypothetical protein MUO52_00645, partial [Desulfobacterales bacterium]|nr:hypothetical protein [Desulfobacterales bacterium]
MSLILRSARKKSRLVRGGIDRDESSITSAGIMKRRRKRFLHLLGFAIVAFWVAMLALLFKKGHFKEQPPAAEHELSVSAIDAVQREWKEIYFGEKKAGYAVTLVKPFGDGYF